MPQLLDPGLASIINTSSGIGVGWKLNFYTTGTSTRKNTYPTAADATAGTNANANPVIIPSDGRIPPVWFLEDANYKCVLTDENDVVKETIDPVNDGGLNSLNFTLDATGAISRTAQDKMADEVSLLDFIPASLRDAIRDGSSTTNVSAYFDAALDYLESLPRGGGLFIPAGVYFMQMDCSRASATDTLRITIRGAGRGATQIKPTGAGVVMLNMVGRNAMTVRDLTLYAGDVYQAYAGIILARSSASNTCNDNHFHNVEVVGNFSYAPVGSFAAESGTWINCKFWPTTDKPCFICGSNPNAASVAVALANLQASANTDIRMIGCNFYSTVTTGPMMILSAAHSMRVYGASFIASVASSHVKFVDPNTGIMGLNTAFTNCHFEGLAATGAVFYATTGGTSYLYGLQEEGCSFQITNGAAYLDYDRTAIANVLVLDACRFRPGKLLDTTQTEFNLYCDIAVATSVDWSNIKAQGAVCVFSTASERSTLIGNVRCWAATDSIIPKPTAAALPTAGVFHLGAIVGNNAAVAGGPAAGWVAIHAGSVDTDPGGRTVTTTNGSPTATLGGSYAEVYDGGRYYVTGSAANLVVRKRSGTTVYFSANATSTGSTDIKSSGANAGTTFVTIPAGPLTGSATYDPANLVDAAGATTTVTVTGAALGDFAEASFSLDLQGITLTAWVSAADTVSVRFQNETGGAIDLGSGTLRARVRKN